MSPVYWTSLIYLSFGMVIVLLGGMVLKENGRQRLNRIAGMMLILAGSGPMLAAFGFLMELSTPDNHWLPVFRRLFVLWEFFFPQLLLFSLVFPKERPLGKRPGLTVFLIFLPHIMHVALLALFNSPDDIHTILNLSALADRFGFWIQPLLMMIRIAQWLLSLILRFHLHFFAFINLLYIVAAITLMMLGHRDIQSPSIRRKVGLVLWGIRVSMGIYLLIYILPRLNIFTPPSALIQPLTIIAMATGLGAVGWAIIRYQFLDLRFMMRRGFVVSLTFGILIGLYLLIYSQGKRVITHSMGIEVPILEILFIMISLLGFQPMLSGVERFVEKLFSRDQRDMRHALNNLSQDILSALTLDELKEKLGSTLKTALNTDTVMLLLPGPHPLFSVQHESRHWAIRFQPSTEAMLTAQAAPLKLEDLALRAAHDEAIATLKAMGPRWVLPLVHRSHLKGVLLLGSDSNQAFFSMEDRTLLTLLSQQCAIAIENTELYRTAIEKKRMEEELSFARDIQRHLLPARNLNDAHVEICGYALPSKEVGGDYYDFFDLDENQLGIAIGDISGKGVPAALLMSNLQAALRLCARPDQASAQVVSQVNAHIAKTTAKDRFATFFYSVYDRQTRCLEYTNAGHNYPLHIPAAGTPRWLTQSHIIIGVKPDFQFSTHCVQLKPGDMVLLYTDGVTEAMSRSGQQYSEERLMDVVSRSRAGSGQALLDEILADVSDYTDGYLQSDDLTIVVVKVK